MNNDINRIDFVKINALKKHISDEIFYLFIFIISSGLFLLISLSWFDSIQFALLSLIVKWALWIVPLVFRLYESFHKKYEMHEWNNLKIKEYENTLNSNKLFFLRKNCLFINIKIINFIKKSKKINYCFENLDSFKMPNDFFKKSVLKKYIIGHKLYIIFTLILTGLSFYPFYKFVFLWNIWWLGFILILVLLLFFVLIIFMLRFSFLETYSDFLWKNKEIINYEKKLNANKLFFLWKNGYKINQKILKYIDQNNLIVD